MNSRFLQNEDNNKAIKVTVVGKDSQKVMETFFQIREIIMENQEDE